MTIYIDNMFVPARVGRIDSKWCHLFSTDFFSEELHAFAAGIGLKRKWFQYTTKVDGSLVPPWRWHYDVTLAARKRAVAAGATECDIHFLSEVISAKRAEFDALPALEQEQQRGRWKDIAIGRVPPGPTLF